MWPKEKKLLSKLSEIPANAVFQGHDCYSMLSGNVGEIVLYTCGGTWRECGVCCVSWSVRGPFPLFPWGPLESGAWAIHPREHGWFDAVVILAGRLFGGFVFLTLTPLMAIITLQLFLPYLLDWTSSVFFTSDKQQVLHPAGHLNSNWNTSPCICKSVSFYF